MRTFTIEEKHHSPRIYLDENRELVEITGNSTLRETNWFYGNFFKWLVAFNLGEHPTRIVNLRLKKLNPSSTKWLTLVFNQVSHVLPHANFEINCYLDSNDHHLESFGKMLKDQSVFKVNLLMN